jgi:hypothetical protein
MKLTREMLKEILSELLMDSEFKRYSFRIRADFQSFDEEMIPQDDPPFDVEIRANDSIGTVLRTFHIDPPDGERFAEYVRGRASREVREIE